MPLSVSANSRYQYRSICVITFSPNRFDCCRICYAKSNFHQKKALRRLAPNRNNRSPIQQLFGHHLAQISWKIGDSPQENVAWAKKNVAAGLQNVVMAPPNCGICFWKCWLGAPLLCMSSKKSWVRLRAAISVLRVRRALESKWTSLGSPKSWRELDVRTYRKTSSGFPLCNLRTIFGKSSLIFG